MKWCALQTLDPQSYGVTFLDHPDCVLSPSSDGWTLWYSCDDRVSVETQDPAAPWPRATLSIEKLRTCKDSPDAPAFPFDPPVDGLQALPEPSGALLPALLLLVWLRGPR